MLIDQAEILKTRGPNRIDPLLASKVGSNMVGCTGGSGIWFQGPQFNINSACASGSDALVWP
jgi:3-oxoacyl-(acyl-carrier-protein) synthase